MRWRPCLSLAVLWTLCAGVFVSAQTWPTIPPIPIQERFRARSDLAVTLNLDSSQLMAGDVPTFTLTFRNTGTGALRIPPYVSVQSNVNLGLFDSSGHALGPTVICIAEFAGDLKSVRDYVRLSPGQTRTFALRYSCGGGLSLRPGDYQFQATYTNYPDSIAHDYDVYETGATEVWDGRITAPRAPLKVLPLDGDTERTLITRLDAGGSPDGLGDAIRRLGLGGSPRATPALVRRFDDDPAHRSEIAWALARIPDPAAPAALAAAVDRLPPDQRIAFQRQTAPSVNEPVVVTPQRPSPSERFVDERPSDPAAVTEYVAALIQTTAHAFEMQVELEGVGRFGTVEDFLRLKAAFDARSEGEREVLEQALFEMTFVSDRDLDKTPQPAYWDAWWKAHAQMTRVQWAREALQRPRAKDLPRDFAPSLAAEFLIAQQGLQPALVRELAQHRSWLVRLSVADAVAEADAQSGGRLYIREFNNRYAVACNDANRRLETLVRRRYPFDCRDPEQRQQAIAHWTKVVDSMEPGFLPLTVATARP